MQFKIVLLIKHKCYHLGSFEKAQIKIANYNQYVENVPQFVNLNKYLRKTHFKHLYLSLQ